MSDCIEEISEDLEADLGKPYNVSEDNSHYMLRICSVPAETSFRTYGKVEP